MDDEHIIEITRENERRLRERRATDRPDDLAIRVTVLERAASDYRLYVASTERNQRERRYAILQAAAILMSSGRSVMLDWPHALQTAEQMLNELERKDSLHGS